MIKKQKQSRKPVSRLKRIAVVLLLSFTAIFIYVDFSLRPSVVSMAQYKMKSLVTQAVNKAIIEKMEENEISYEELVVVHKDESGVVTSVTYDSLQVNKLKSEIIEAVIEETNKIDDTKIYIPIGNITHIDLLQSKGPRLEFTITPSTYVSADIESNFQNTGINQVHHQIFIVVKVVTSALVPNYSTNVEVESKVCVAQTIIIGKVPNNIGNSVVNPAV